MAEGKGRILVVDDDPTLLLMLIETLTSIGYQAVAATDGIEALDQLRNQDQKFDLIITDIKMPNMDGVNLLKKTRRQFPDLPVLFITGFASNDIMADNLADGFLAKPFRISHLESLIEKTLSKNESGRDRTLPRKVLINVPEDRIRDTISRVLDYSDYLPFAVAGSDEALEELERGSFDVMIGQIERYLPLAVAGLDRVNRKHPSLPLVIFSSTCTAEELNELRGKVRVDGFANQPFRAGELIALLDQAVEPATNPQN